MGVYGSIEDDDEIDWSPTGHFCSAHCGEAIDFADETHVMTIVLPSVVEGGIVYSPAVTPDGSDYLYEPCFFCVECWESIVETLLELKADEPPIADEYAALECTTCASGIRAGEVIGLTTFGEVHRSKRSPNGQPGTPTFQSMDNNPRILCISCLNLLSQEIIDLWSGRVTQHEECLEGSHIRCWRLGCSAEGRCANAQQEETG